MRVERLDNDKVKIYMSYEDLKERGLAKDDIWSDKQEVHDLLNDIMDEVYDELGFEVFGSVAIEVFALPTKGVIVIITRANNFEHPAFFQLDVRISHNNYIIFEFKEFDDLVDAAHKAEHSVHKNSKVLYLDGKYLLFIDEDEFAIDDYDTISALLSEYGNISQLTKEYLLEYAKVIIENNAIQELINNFG